MKCSPPAPLIPILITATLFLACTTQGEGHHRATKALLEEYRTLPDERAIALAGDPNLTWVAGMAGGLGKKAEAASKALEECKKRRSANRMKMPCRPYAAGDEIIWGTH